MSELFGPMPKCTIPLDERHVPACRELWERRFGRDPHMDKWLTESQINEDPASTQGFVTTQGGQVLGFGLATIAEPEYARRYLTDQVDFDPWEWTGILHLLIVREDRENEAIGSELVKARLQWLRIEDARGVVGVAWHRENHVDSRVLFEKFGFDRVVTVPEFYDNLTDGDSISCVDCEASCRCDASVHSLEFPGGGSS